MSISESPWAILGVARGATQAEARAAYLEKLRAYPPERAPEMFERIRDAYAALRAEAAERPEQMLEANPNAPLASLLDALPAARKHVGATPWLAAMRALRKEPS
jgi:curved DNA-binding protein CbpA